MLDRGVVLRDLLVVCSLAPSGCSNDTKCLNVLMLVAVYEGRKWLQLVTFYTINQGRIVVMCG